MVKTQIQLPEELYGALKGLAARQEWSLAETLRRGAEQILQQYPPSGGPAASAAVWQPPVSSKCGWNGLSATDLKAALAADTEPRLSAG